MSSGDSSKVRKNKNWLAYCQNRLEAPSTTRFNRCQEAAEPSPKSNFDKKKA